MRRRHFIKTGLIFVPTLAFADRRALLNRAPAAAAATCNTVQDQNSLTVSRGFGNCSVGDNTYTGQALYTPGSNFTLCKCSFALTKQGSDISGFAWRAEVWTHSGNNLAALQATSDNVTGVNAWSETIVDFTFPTPLAMSNATAYAIVLTRGAVDGTNYIWVEDTAGGGIGGLQGIWNAAGTNIAFGDDTKLALYKA